MQNIQPTDGLRPRDSMQFTNDGFLNEADMGRLAMRRPDKRERKQEATPKWRVRAAPRERQGYCNSCGMRVHSNHVHHGSPTLHPKTQGAKDQVRSILTKERRKDGQKTVWFKESEDSSDIEVEIIPDDIGLKHKEEDEDSSSLALKTSDMELGELTMTNIQDSDKQQENVSDHQESPDPDKTGQ